MQGAGIKFIILVMIGIAVIGGCVAPSGDNKTETVGQNASATTPTPTPSNAQIAASDSKIPAWLNLDKDWRDRVVGKLNLPADGAGLKRTAGGDDQYDDNEIVVGDGVAEMMAGIQGNDIALVVDRDFFEKYGPKVSTNFQYSDGGQSILFEDFTDLGNGLYYVLVPIGGKDDMGFSGSGSPKTQEEANQIPQLEFEKK